MNKTVCQVFLLTLATRKLWIRARVQLLYLSDLQFLTHFLLPFVNSCHLNYVQILK